uniref:AAA+ ATPase domain-containing protein n=1 Tax=Anopheles atroparvus TaxID=41427 RepID=A0A182J422_ANOAO
MEAMLLMFSREFHITYPLDNFGLCWRVWQRVVKGKQLLSLKLLRTCFQATSTYGRNGAVTAALPFHLYDKQTLEKSRTPRTSSKFVSRMTLILVTGMPGVGKTTILRRLGDELALRNVPIAGFYTEEVRDSLSGERVGFDVVTYTGQRGPLARVGGVSRPPGPSVGRYSVCLKEFESLASAALDQRHQIAASGGMLLLDEIGKMELKSRAFQERMQAIVGEVTARKLRFVATVPLKAKGIDLIDRLQRIPGCQLYHVKPSNRDSMYEQIKDAALGLLTK